MPASIQITSPAGGATVSHNFSAAGTANEANGNSASGEVWFQGQKSNSTNTVTIANNAWSGLNFSLPSSWSGGATLKVTIVGTPQGDMKGINIGPG